VPFSIEALFKTLEKIISTLSAFSCFDAIEDL
jgi:hypothetical protein